MLFYLVLFALLTPLSGLIAMEFGAFGGSFGGFGHRNGASLAFCAYAVPALLTARYVVRKKWGMSRKPGASAEQVASGFSALGIVVLAVIVMCLTVMLFAVGGVRVLTGEVGKGEFRATLGGFGALTYWITKFFVPVLLAYLAAIYLSARKNVQNKLLMAASFAATFVLGLTLGFKTSSIFVLMPAIILLNWRVSFRKVMAYGLIFAVITFGTFVWFDRTQETAGTIFTTLVVRATVLQGDVSWYVWETYVSGKPLPEYGRTLLAVFGDRVFSLLTGYTRDHQYEWVMHHYDFMLTWIIGNPVWAIIEKGHNVTGTPFSEGVIAAGWPGILFFGVFSGVLVGMNYNIIRSALERNRPVTAAIGATYFLFGTFSYLNGGGVVQLAHPSIVLGLSATWLVIKTLETIVESLVSPAQPALPDPQTATS